MFHIKSVSIIGFWGDQNIKVHFGPEENIIIGPNGTGKTQLIEIINAILAVDIPKIQYLNFESVIFELKDKDSETILEVYRGENEIDGDYLIYIIEKKEYIIAIQPFMVTRKFRDRHVNENRKAVVEAIASLVSIHTISVNRGELLNFEERIGRDFKSITDIALYKASQEFTAYQLSLSNLINLQQTDFQRKVLGLMLYDEEFDRFNINSPILDYNTNQIEISLNNAYRELGIYEQSKEQISKHVSRVRRVSVLINKIKAKEDDIDMQDGFNDVLFSMPILSRTSRIIELTSEIIADKQNIMAPIDKFLFILSTFFTDKNIYISKNGQLLFFKGDRQIEQYDLSSGEKQVLILLITALLQDGKPTTFIADEPEISLHIKWQKMILPSIRDLNPNAQLIVATHSPEVAGSSKKSLIRMEKLFYA